MENMYNERPLKVGFIEGFSKLTRKQLDEIRLDLGLVMSTTQLERIAKEYPKKANKMTTDALYMADRLLSTVSNAEPIYSIDELTSDSSELCEAFADVMQKRAALGFGGNVTLDTVADVYKNYLIAAGYDRKDRHPNAVILESTASGIPGLHCKYLRNSAFGTDKADYFISEDSTDYAFNTSKDRIGTPNSAERFDVLLVRLPEGPLSFEGLASIIHRNAHMSADVRYCAPIGDCGLLYAISGLKVGFNLNMDVISSFVGRPIRPYELASPMNAAVLIATNKVAKLIAQTLVDFSFDVRYVGSSSQRSGEITVSYLNATHTVYTNQILSMIPIRVAHPRITDVCSDNAFFDIRRSKAGISALTFSHLTFSETYTYASDEISSIKETSPEKEIFAFFVLPFIVTDDKLSLSPVIPELLGIYKALAESGIPLVKAHFVPSNTEKNASLFLIEK